MLGYFLRHIPELSVYAAVFVIQCVAAAVWLRRKGSTPGRRRAVAVFVIGSMLLLGAAFVGGSSRLSVMVPHRLAYTVRFIGIGYGVMSVAIIGALGIVLLLPKPAPEASPGRRRFLQSARGLVLAGPAAAMGYGVFIERRDLRLTEVDVPIAGLPKDLHGIRLVQLTDIHLSPYLSRQELRRAVDMANETRAHIGLVTGDLITTAADPLYDCIDELKRLRVDAGIFGCHGNHENYARCTREATAAGARAGIRFLRGENAGLRFGTAALNIAGVDYQRFHAPYLAGSESLVRPAEINVLLSHNPDVFPVATDEGFHLTVSGHTHGGQISTEILDSNISVARFYTPYVYGLYRRGAATQWVGRGIGTVGFPVRLGAPPEVALLRLCAT